MKDQTGTDRGQCEFEDCICVEFVKPKVSKDGTFKCDYCDHAPSQHKNTMMVKHSTKQSETPTKSASQSNSNEGWDASTNTNNNTNSSPSQSTNKTATTTQPAPRKEVAVASSSRDTKKKSILDDLKNPSQMIKNATKQKKH